MKTGSVPVAWFELTGMLLARPLLLLLEEVDRRGVAHDDLEAVRAVWQAVRWPVAGTFTEGQGR